MTGRIILFLALVATASPALAGLKVCNRTRHDLDVALGRYNGRGWMSEGWWLIAAADCATLIPKALQNRYYYLYASDGGAGSWGGSHDFCVAPGSAFRISGRGDCAAAGFERRGFFEVDTGQSSAYVQTLSN